VQYLIEKGIPGSSNDGQESMCDTDCVIFSAFMNCFVSVSVHS
jgi:hypothetical protein